jgi:hypothetical protein
MHQYAKLQILLVTIAVITLSLLYFFYPAASGSFHPNCIFHELTGLFCPGCGSQRATSALLHGHFLQAADLNLLFVLSLPLILYSAFVFAWNSFSSKKLKQAIFYSPLFVKSFLVVVVLFGVLRNLPYYPLNLLAP